MRKGMALRASMIALGCAVAAPQTAHAQSATEVLRDTILVTGTKKKDAENVQDVPLAVTAYGADQLDALKVRDLQSLTTAVPNVSFDDIGTTPALQTSPSAASVSTHRSPALTRQSASSRTASISARMAAWCSTFSILNRSKSCAGPKAFSSAGTLRAVQFS